MNLVFVFVLAFIALVSARQIALENTTQGKDSIAKANATIIAGKDSIAKANDTNIVAANTTRDSFPLANTTNILAVNITLANTTTNATDTPSDDWEKGSKPPPDDDSFPHWALGLTCGLSVPVFFACFYGICWFQERLRICCAEEDKKAVQKGCAKASADIDELEDGKVIAIADTRQEEISIGFDAV